MKTLIAVALTVAGVALPVCAQRGGSRGISMGGSMGRGGSIAIRSAPSSQGGVPSMGRTSFMSAPQMRNPGPTSNLRIPTRGPNDIQSNRRTGGPGEHGFRLGSRFRRPYIPFYGIGFGYGYPGYFDPGYLGYPDSSLYDNSAYGAAQPPGSYPAGDDARPMDQADAAPATAYRPAYVRPQPAQEPVAETPVTLIFKDGRPPEQVQNYMVTHTTVYVQETHLREIPLDQLDLAATEKVNRDTGGDFILPQAGR